MFLNNMYRSFVVEISLTINHTHGFIIYNNCFSTVWFRTNGLPL